MRCYHCSVELPTVFSNSLATDYYPAVAVFASRRCNLLLAPFVITVLPNYRALPLNANGAPWPFPKTPYAATVNRPPSYRRCISAFHYQAPVDNIILRLKGNPYTKEIKQLCAILAQHIAATYQQAQLPCPQTIIPLPLHWLKMTKRGFNQSHIISNLLAADLRREHKVTLEIRSDVCRRILKGQDQHLLSAKKRRTSIKNAFIAEAKDLKGLSVAIVDDVVTTGATANSAAKALLRAGAAQVDIWSIARTSWNNPTG